MELRRWAFAGLALAALAGCSGGDRRPSGYEAALNALRTAFAPTITLPGPQITRALLDRVQGPLLQITNPDGRTATLGLSARRGDDLIWRESTGRLLHLRDGLVASTRGLQEELISAETAAVSAALERALHNNEASIAERRMVYLDATFAQIPVIYDCTITPIGPQTITVIEKDYAVFEVSETCILASDPEFLMVPDTFENTYWFERDRAQTLRQSRQWGSPNLGFVTITQLSP